MAVPVPSIRDSSYNEITYISFGSLHIGAISDPILIRVCNNYGGATPVSDMMFCKITTWCSTGVGVTACQISEGYEVVNNKAIEVNRVGVDADGVYNEIGGDTMLPIGVENPVPTEGGTIPDGQCVTLMVRFNGQKVTTRGAINWKIAVRYSYI